MELSQVLNGQHKIMKSGWLILLFYVFSFAYSANSLANSGADWLAAQITVDNSYTSPFDIATSTQATAETIQVLHTLGVINQTELQNSVEYLEANSVKNTENLTRIILNQSQAGSETSSLVTELQKHSHLEGGFGGFEGYTRTALDTAFRFRLWP